MIMPETQTDSQENVRDTLIVQMYRCEKLSPREVKAPGLLRTLTVPSKNPSDSLFALMVVL